MHISVHIGVIASICIYALGNGRTCCHLVHICSAAIYVLCLHWCSHRLQEDHRTLKLKNATCPLLKIDMGLIDMRKM